MPADLESRLRSQGIELPKHPDAPKANYMPYVRVHDLLYVSGQLSAGAEGLITGKLGLDVDTDAGVFAARCCAVSLLAQVKAACEGDLDRLVRVVKLVGFVNSTPDFTEQSIVINGASDLLAQALGAAGRHARSAVSVAALPFGAAVEIEGIFAIR
ncbi:MAG: RidA family protein [Rhodobacteraceae bacterium]|nr:RidA family protein [Paracoccaceae bacterium]